MFITASITRRYDRAESWMKVCKELVNSSSTQATACLLDFTGYFFIDILVLYMIDRVSYNHGDLLLL